MASVMASNVPDGYLSDQLNRNPIAMPNYGLLYIPWVLAHCSVVGLWHATVAECVCMYSTRDQVLVLVYRSVGSTPAVHAFDVKCIESDSHSSMHTIFVLDTINAMVI